MILSGDCERGRALPYAGVRTTCNVIETVHRLEQLERDSRNSMNASTKLLPTYNEWAFPRHPCRTWINGAGPRGPRKESDATKLTRIKSNEQARSLVPPRSFGEDNNRARSPDFGRSEMDRSLEDHSSTTLGSFATAQESLNLSTDPQTRSTPSLETPALLPDQPVFFSPQSENAIDFSHSESNEPDESSSIGRAFSTTRETSDALHRHDVSRRKASYPTDHETDRRGSSDSAPTVVPARHSVDRESNSLDKDDILQSDHLSHSPISVEHQPVLSTIHDDPAKAEWRPQSPCRFDLPPRSVRHTGTLQPQHNENDDEISSTTCRQQSLRHSKRAEDISSGSLRSSYHHPPSNDNSPPSAPAISSIAANQSGEDDRLTYSGFAERLKGETNHSKEHDKADISSSSSDESRDSLNVQSESSPITNKHTESDRNINSTHELSSDQVTEYMSNGNEAMIANEEITLQAFSESRPVSSIHHPHVLTTIEDDEEAESDRDEIVPLSPTENNDDILRDSEPRSPFPFAKGRRRSKETESTTVKTQLHSSTSDSSDLDLPSSGTRLTLIEALKSEPPEDKSFLTATARRPKPARRVTFEEILSSDAVRTSQAEANSPQHHHRSESQGPKTNLRRSLHQSLTGSFMRTSPAQSATRPRRRLSKSRPDDRASKGSIEPRRPSSLHDSVDLDTMRPYVIPPAPLPPEDTQTKSRYDKHQERGKSTHRLTRALSFLKSMPQRITNITRRKQNTRPKPARP